MIASTKNWKSLFNYATNIARLTIGTIVPIVPKLLQILKAVGMGVVDLPGINDLEENSVLLNQLNNTKANRSKYFVFTSNYEPDHNIFKRLFDEFLVDRAIFKREVNDSIAPVSGAIFQNKEFSHSVKLEEISYYISPSDKGVSHFSYLHPKHPEILVKLFEII